MKPCKHLDYDEDRYAGSGCQIMTCAPHFPDVKFWRRPDDLIDALTLPDCPAPPRNVQFCGQGRGRINGIFQCYNGEMHCYEPEQD